jgi:CHRD domain
MPVVAIRRLLAVLALAVAVVLLVVVPGGAQTTATTKCTAFAVLKPGNEVPPTNSQATGAALVHINGTRVTFTVAIANPARETFFAGHIHRGAAGVNGPIIVPLFDGSSDRRLFTQFASITDEDAATVCADLAGHYVNYHTTDFRGGAIRGQLTKLF